MKLTWKLAVPQMCVIVFLGLCGFVIIYFSVSAPAQTITAAFVFLLACVIVIPFIILLLRLRKSDARWNAVSREREEMLEQIHIESEMAEAVARWYESVLNAVPQPISVTDANMNWTFLNEASKTMLGRQGEDLIGKNCSNWNANICGTNACGVACVKRGVKQTFFRRAGSTYQVDVETLKDLTGATTGFVEIVQDITQIEQMARRQADAEKEAGERTKLILDSSPMGCVLWNRGVEPIDCNESFVKLYGYNDAAHAMEHILDCSSEYQPDGVKSETALAELIETAFREGRRVSKWEHRTLDGTPVPAEVTLVRVKYGNDYVVVSYSRDLRQQERMMREIEDALNTAQDASRVKSDFLSRMSHEMRTPMNAIVGMTNIARGTRDAGKKDDCLDKIEAASKHLLSVINDILDMSKIEANKFELALYPFNFEKMLINVSNVLSFLINEKNQKFTVSIDKNIPSTIIGDEFRLTQVITNLLTNAVKFTPKEGDITLNVSLLGDEELRCHLLVEVIDTGIGISEEHLTRLFSAFEQADNSTARKFGGTGLGLAISKHIVELMGGRIWVKSESGRGAKFSFTVTLQKGEEQVTLPYIDRDSVEILAVDDAPEIREYFTAVMGRLGFHCDTAADGARALEMISMKAGRPYNMFFVDWLMPEMDGIELARRIKETDPDGSIVVMISGAEWSRIVDEGKKAGADRFISKPLFPSTLFSVIEDCTGGARISEVSEARFNAGYEGRSILVAEDIEINREIVAMLLEDTGVQIDFAENGTQAVEMFETAPGKYGVILMDLQMPEMDGFGATRAIRALPCKEAAAIPIIAMTANVFKEDVEACLAVGMDDHLGKPIDVEALFEKLHTYL